MTDPQSGLPPARLRFALDLRAHDEQGHSQPDGVARAERAARTLCCVMPARVPPYRPRALRVLAEHLAGDPVWDSDPDHLGPVVLADLGVSPRLVGLLRAWNEQFEATARTGFAFPSPAAERRWVREGLRLAYELQNELPDIEISYAHDADPRPVRERRGP